jgi:uracil-DNA glycosylase family 4
MGVDFVPSYRSRAAGPDRSPAEGAHAVPTSDSLVEVKGGGERIELAPVVVTRVGRTTGGDAARAESSGKAGSVSGEEAQRKLDELRARYEREAPHAPFITSFTNIVFGEGDPRARLMFVGEAPGEQEDLTGRPFVGRAGDLLQKMITAMGLTREGVYIANVLKVRPPNNATPTPEEAQASAPFLFEQIDIVRPEAIVTLGLPASRLLLETTASMASLRGLWATFTTPSGHAVPVMPTYHPAFLLRAYTTENRAKVWSDLQKVVERLGLKAGG